MPTKTEEQQKLESIATPTRLAQKWAPDLIAEEYQVDPWLLDLERRVLEAYADPRKRGLVVNVPSQCGKSSYTGLWFPTWVLGMDPTTRILYITYGETYSAQWTRWVRDALEKFGEDEFGVQVNPKNKSASDWQMEGSQGGMIALGILGGITGKAGNIVIVEDVIRNMEQADNPEILDKHWKEFTGAIIPRVQSGGLVLVIATRYADGDLSGRLVEYIENLEGEPDDSGIVWENVNYQAIAEPPDGYDNSDGHWRDPVLGREEGEELQTRHGPGHFTGMQKFMAEANPYVWAAIFQGEPTAPKGSSFPQECWLWYDPDDEEFIAQVGNRLRMWDFAASVGTDADWSVGQLWGSWQGRLVLLEQTRFRKLAGDVRQEVKNTAAMDGRMVVIKMEEEKVGSAGKTIIDLYKEDMPSFLLEGIRPVMTKDRRIAWYSQLQNRRKIMLPRNAHWLPAFLKEHKAAMPDGRMPRHDDQMDCAAYACMDLFSSGDTIAHFPNAEAVAQLEAQEIAALLGVPYAGMRGV